MTRTCPVCRTSGPPSSFPLVLSDHDPPRHDDARRRCIRCGHVGRAWVYRPTKPAKELAR